MIRFLDRINFKNIFHFLNVINNTFNPKQDSVEYHYRKKETNFNEIKSFLSNINLVFENNKMLNFSDSLLGNRFESKEEIRLLKKEIFQHIINPGNKEFFFCKEYFAMYEYENDEYLHFPTSRERLHYSGIRNLFMELGAVTMVDEGRFYKINKNYESSLKHLLAAKGSLSPRQLKVAMDNNNRIGREAELRIIQYEIERLSNTPFLLSKIEHIAERIVNAGYDVLSFDYEPKTKEVLNRHIEVKAVPAKDYRFFMSRSEINTATKLRERYFLYLLPVIRNNTFDINGLEIISDPLVNILGNKQAWFSETENYSFKKI